MFDLSVIIPARNEEWLTHTIDDILRNSSVNTEIIAILDGYWPDVGIRDHHRLKLIHHTEPIGQRAATNEGVRISESKYIMKADAHCAFDKDFDVKLMNDMRPEFTMVPRMYNLHVFDWKCDKCGYRQYMGPLPEKCTQCGDNKFSKEVVWQPRLNRRSDFMRFDNTLHFQYWKGYERRPEAQGNIVDQMACVGACWMMERERYWYLDGMDERHGSWGQMGVELACKSALSGGRQVVNKRTWFAHLFRTQQGFGFPYPNPGIAKAREYSNWLWRNGNWPKAKYKLSWLLEKFWPVDDWTDEDLQKQKELEYGLERK